MMVRRAEARGMSPFGHHAEIGETIQLLIDRPLPVLIPVLAPS
jgi:hypothetical protein